MRPWLNLNFSNRRYFDRRFIELFHVERVADTDFTFRNAKRHGMPRIAALNAITAGGNDIATVDGDPLTGR